MHKAVTPPIVQNTKLMKRALWAAGHLDFSWQKLSSTFFAFEWRTFVAISTSLARGNTKAEFQIQFCMPLTTKVRVKIIELMSATGSPSKFGMGIISFLMAARLLFCTFSNCFCSFDVATFAKSVINGGQEMSLLLLEPDCKQMWCLNAQQWVISNSESFCLKS